MTFLGLDHLFGPPNLYFMSQEILKLKIQVNHLQPQTMHTPIFLVLAACLSIVVWGFSPLPVKICRQLGGSSIKSNVISSMRSHHGLVRSLSMQRISFDDEEEGEESEEEESAAESSAEVEVSADTAMDAQISLIKQGLNISSFLNGSDVRVGIIMARWNADIIQGLYKVR